MIRKYITNFIVLVVFGVGLASMIGWFEHTGKFAQVIESIASTKFNGSVCFIMAAISLYLIHLDNRNRVTRNIASFCSWTIVTIAVLTLIEYITEIKMGIDQVIVNDVGAAANPGRIELIACIEFLFIGCILLDLKTERSKILTQILLPIVFFAAVFITFNYVSGLDYLETISFARDTALTTNITIMAFCIAIFYCRPLQTITYSFQQKIAGYFAVAFLVLGIVFFTFAANSQKLIRSGIRVNHTKDVLLKTSSVLSNTQEIQAATLGYVQTANEALLEPFSKSAKEIFQNIDELRELTAENIKQQQKIDSLRQLTTESLELRNRLIQLKKSLSMDAMLSYGLVMQEQALMNRLEALIEEIQAIENAALVERQEFNDTAVGGAQRLVPILQILVLLIFVVVFVIISRNIRSRNAAEEALRKNERFVRSIIDNAAATISIKDTKGRFMLLNKEGEKFVGRPEKELLGKTMYDFFPHDNAAEGEALDNAAIESGKLVEFEVKVPDEFGGRSFISTRFPLFDENNKVYAVCSMSTDITQVKQAQEAVEAASRQQQYILNGMQDLMAASLDVICVVDEKGFLQQISANCQKVFGYAPEEMIGRHYADFLVPEDRDYSVSHESILISEKITTDFENRGLRKDRSVVPLLWTNVWSEETRSFYSIIKDATEKKMTAQQLADLNENLRKRAAELQASNTELERFAYVASHDLQEPLRMVSSFLQLLEKKLEGTLDETGRKYIAFAIDGAERMKTLIQDLLQYSRIGTSKEMVVSVDMNEVLKNVKSIFALAISETNAHLEIAPMPVIRAEKAQMQQLFQNLIGNAIKYSKPKVPRIIVGFREEPEHWLFSVKDHGIGINPRFFEKIFVIFQRLHNKTEYSGTGIGLAICKKIAERHGGTIWVESELNEGTTFFVRLPKY